MREVGEAQGITNVVEHLTPRQVNDLQMRLESRKVLRLQGGQQTVPMVVGSILGHGDLIAPFTQRG
jgi:hypothetical protein